MLNGNFVYSIFASSTLIYHFPHQMGIRSDVASSICGKAIPFNFNFITSLINYVVHIVVPDAVTFIDTSNSAYPLSLVRRRVPSRETILGHS